MKYVDKFKNQVYYNRFLEKIESNIRKLFKKEKIIPFCTIDNIIRYRNNIHLVLGVNNNENKFIIGVQKKSFISMQKLNISHPLINFTKILNEYTNYNNNHIIPIKDLIYASNNAINISNTFEKFINTHINIIPHDIFRGIQIREVANIKDYYMIIIKLFLPNKDYELAWENIEESLVTYMVNNNSTKLLLASIYKQITINNIESTNKDLYYEIYKKYDFKQQIDDFYFKISPGAFFQINTKTAIKMYKLIKKIYLEELCNLELIYDNIILLDICCGTGTIGLYLSDYAKKVIGFEINSDAINNCIENSKINDKENTVYIQGPVEKTIHPIIYSLSDINVLIPIINPPKRGLYPPVIDILNTYSKNIKFIIYVSCNPKSFHKDYEYLKQNYYIKKIHLLDQFPLTNDAEMIVILYNNNN